MRRIVSAIATAAALVAALPALAQVPTDHIRGKVKSLTGSSLVVQGKNGKVYAVSLSTGWTVTVVKPVEMSAIAPGSFIGTTNINRPDGSGRSLEVHVFPPGVKMGEGHYAWDLKPHSMMTNGTVGKVTTGSHGRTLEVAYAGGTRTIVVPPGAPVVGFGPGAPAMIKPGVAVFILATKAADGALNASGVTIGEKGAAPPM